MRLQLANVCLAPSEPQRMISLKRFLDRNREKMPDLFTGAYLALVETMAAGAVLCCPPTGEILERELSTAIDALKRERNSRSFESCQQKALKSLRSWGEESAAYLTRKTADIKDMLTELARTAESIGDRDKRYASQFHELTTNLQTIAHLDDITRLKGLVLQSAAELKSCVDQMASERMESVAQLEASLASHRVALQQAQELATLDPLTGLCNRREVETRLAQRVSNQTPFCVAVIDLNNFRRINEQHGHTAGDEVLRQIARELRASSRIQDTLGRWGGNEFIMVIDGGYASTRVKVQRLRPWVFGNYDLDLSGTKLSVVVKASIGMAEWSAGETLLQLLGRADDDMARDKAANLSLNYS
jgi:diguanylate cyclase (GGDEF)-like protein